MKEDNLFYHRSQMFCHSSEMYLLSKVQGRYLLLEVCYVQGLSK